MSSLAPGSQHPEHPDPHLQGEATVRLRWGRRGAREAAAAGDVLVVVDVLSFSTACALATARGVLVHPCPPGDGASLAARLGARLAGRREAGGPSLSPASLAGLAAGTRLVLPSPNGALCSTLGARCPAVLLGALVCARATARAAARACAETGRALSVLACGERWSAADPDDGALRVALEDQLGAGAVIAALQATGPSPSWDARPSAEAIHTALAFEAARPRLAELLADCGSGRELRARGFPQDVAAAAELDAVEVAPWLVLDGDAPCFAAAPA
ncbi:MAG: 2-phosphosulfolactate phosphatase [Planctomycetota bacterium]